jgi:hypothetical protein
MKPRWCAKVPGGFRARQIAQSAHQKEGGTPLDRQGRKPVKTCYSGGAFGGLPATSENFRFVGRRKGVESCCQSGLQRESPIGNFDFENLINWSLAMN